MAVLQPSAYAGIQEALKQRADLASNAPPSTLGVLTKTVGTGAGAYAGAKIASSMESDQQKDLLTFKSKLEDDLNRNKEKYKAQGEGRIFLDQPTVSNYWKQQTGDDTHAPNVGDGIYTTPTELQNTLKHAQFQTELEKQADQLMQSKDPSDLHRARLLRIMSNIPQDKLSDEKTIETLRKTLVPESEISKTSEAPSLSVDNFGRKVKTWPDGRTQILNGAPKATPQGELASEQAQLHPAELDTFKKGLNEFDTKAIKDSKQSFKDLDKLETAVKENNPVSFFNNKIELVRLGGISAGRISQGEIVQEAGARDFVSKMQQKIQSFKEGDWTPENRKLIGKYIDSLKAIEGEHVKNALDESVSKTVSSMPDPGRVDPDFVKAEFSKPIAKYLPEETVTVVNPKGVSGTIKKSKLDAALKAGYKLAPTE